MRRRAALGLAALLVGGLGLAPASAEGAPAPERTAWWSAASGGGLAAPQPGTAEGDLRVVRALEPQAFSTLLYRGEGARAGLVLEVRPTTAAGTPDVLACPTVGADWDAGGNQPAEAAPEVDCSAFATGVLSDDGLTLSFSLDERFQVEPGTWSIALLPASGEPVVTVPPVVPLPFAVDLVAPEPGDFVLEDAFELPAEVPADVPADVIAPPATSAADVDGADVDGAGSAFGGFDAGSVPSAPSSSLVFDAPMVAGDGGTAVALPAPAVAGGPGTRLPPAFLTRPAGAAQDLGETGRLLALLVLAGGCALVGFAAGQSRPGPQLIGGRARVAAALGGAAAGPVPGRREDRPRGIGRFAKERDAAPRRLR